MAAVDRKDQNEKVAAMGVRSVLDQALQAIRDDILRLGSLVDEAVEQACQSLKNHDKDLAQTVVHNDDAVDSLHNRIEEHVIQTFALQQPMARDLRQLIADLLISNELERMGDHAEGIARAVLRHSGAWTPIIPDQVSLMLDIVHRMMRDVMDAYVVMDPDKARAVARLDDQLDTLYGKLFSLLVGEMSRGALSVEEGTYLLWAGHNLERIGDRVTNICERIVYARTGEVREFNPKPGED